MEVNQFDLYENFDEEDGNSPSLELIWTHLTYDKNKLNRFRIYLASELKRLKRIKNINFYEYNWTSDDITDYEWSNINQFIDANIVAMSMALDDITAPPPPIHSNQSSPSPSEVLPPRQPVYAYHSPPSSEVFPPRVIRHVNQHGVTGGVRRTPFKVVCHRNDGAEGGVGHVVTVSSFDELLTYSTKKLKLNWAARKVYRMNGHLLRKSNELQHGLEVVISCGDPFKPRQKQKS